jgi:probable rRNA maturation factor
MQLMLDLQNPAQASAIPDESQMQDWVVSALNQANWQATSAELTVRVVDLLEIQELNKTYRGKNQPTNVLSFPFEIPEHIESDLLGDLVICHQVLVDEAKQQNKNLQDHWAHMVIHGTLHLLGFDHINDDEAEEMEGLEIEILKQYQIENPYN